MWKKTDIFEMIKTNHKIFGEELLQIEKASEEWAINYFTKKLLSLLNTYAECESEIFQTLAEKFGGISNISYKDGFSLTAQQCAEIGNYLVSGNVYIDYYSMKPVVPYYNSKIILNYIENGVSLNANYKLVEVKFDDVLNNWFGAKKNDK